MECNLLNRFIILTFALFFSFSNIKAQGDSTDIFDMSLEELMNIEVVTASKKAQKLSDAPSIISAFSKSDIQRMNVTSLIDILNYIPAIETSMDPTGHYRISIRGARKDGNILLLIDGQNFNNFYDGKAIFDLPAEFIERIEVIRGPGSALFGTNAVAGVINIITIKDENSASLFGGTNNNYGGNFNLSINKEKSKLSFNGGYIQTDGANVMPYTYPVDTFLSGNTNRWLQDIYLNTNINISKFNLSLFGISRKQGSWVGPQYIIAPDSKLNQNQFLGNMSYQIDISPKLSITPKVYFNSSIHDYMMQERPDGYEYLTQVFIDGPITHEKYTGMLMGGDLQLNYAINEKTNLISGFVYENMKMLDFELTRNYYLISKTYLGDFTNYLSPTLEIELNQLHKTRSIMAGYAQVDYTLSKLAFTVGVRYDKYSDFGQSVNPRIGVIYKPSKSINVKMLYGQAFRAPTFKELYDQTNSYDKDGVKGNESLEAENLQSAELAIEFTGAKFLTRANGFYIMNNNIIDIYDPDGGGSVGNYLNLGNTESFGGELELYAYLSKKINLFTNGSYHITSFSWSDSPDIKDAERTYIETRGDDIIHNIPKLRINAGANFTISKFTVMMGANYGSGASANNRFTSEGLRSANIEPYVLGNFSFAYKPIEKLSIRISGNNIGNIKYSDPEASTNINKLGIYGMGQPINSFVLSVKFDF